jgi:hypothetical protein
MVQKYYPESEETLKGHARMFKSGLRAEHHGQDPEVEHSTNRDEASPTKESTAPIKKKKEIFITTYDLQDNSSRKCIRTRWEDSQ